MALNDRNKDSFIEYLERVSKEVDRWPSWKQNALGTIRTGKENGTVKTKTEKKDEE